MARPDGETRKDRNRQWVVGIAVVIGLLSMCSNVALTGQLLRTDANHHNATTKQNNQIIALQKANNALGKQHSGDIANESQLLKSIASADKELNALGEFIYQSDIANCDNSAIAARAAGGTPIVCPVIQKLPPLGK